MEDEAPELDRQSRLLGSRQEVGGAEEAAGRVRPACEHLDALDLPVRKPHDRLVVDEDLAALDRRLEVEAELPLGAKLLVQVRLVQRVRSAPPA